MRGLINGIVDFRKKVRPGYRETFAKLALGQAPDALFIACSDSRVVPNLFASSNPGDLFVVRNVGNLVPPCGNDGLSVGDESEAAALEYSLLSLKVRDVIVCGHSECGAVQAVLDHRRHPEAPHLDKWLRHAEPSLDRLKRERPMPSALPVNHELSQINVLQQLEHLKSYPLVQERIKQGKLGLHGWWFEIATASVYFYDRELNRFAIIDEEAAEKMLNY